MDGISRNLMGGDQSEAKTLTFDLQVGFLSCLCLCLCVFADRPSSSSVLVLVPVHFSLVCVVVHQLQAMRQSTEPLPNVAI